MFEKPSILEVSFYGTDVGNEPVRKWLKSLDKRDRYAIGEDIKVVQFGWPIGMPLIRKLESALWEVRTDLRGGRQARIIFTVEKGDMVILHGFLKYSQKTPKGELDTARQRLVHLRSR